nr:PepSY-associated TM helix domain-containing protein [Tumebacillus amylolyticus]
MLKLHLWLSLGVGLFFVMICLTGSILVLKEDIQKWVDPELYATTPGRVPVETVLATVTKVYPDAHVDSVESPEKADGRYHVRLSKKSGGSQELYLDPGTGNVLGQSGAGATFISWVLKIHRYLLLGDLFGKQTAQVVNAVMGIALTLVLGTGAYLWWPGLRKFALGFRIVRNKGKLMFQRDLHKSLGILSVPLLLVLTLTGTAMTLDKYVFGWFGSPTQEVVPKSVTQVKPEGSPLPVDSLLQNVQSKYPDAQWLNVKLPADGKQAVTVSLEQGYNPADIGNATAYVNPYTGQVLHKTNPQAGITLYQRWKRGLHFASWGGLFSKLLYVLIGVLPLFFMVTGLAIWRIKVSLKSKRKRKLVVVPT